MAKAFSPRTKALIDRILRVDHSGELAAYKIYQGQLAVLGKTNVAPVIEEMWEQEKKHLARFESLLPQYRARPSALTPVWSVAGWALGAGTALLGREAAMACTVAVESVIGNHYNNQIRQLMTDDPEAHRELLEILKEFRDEELEHHDIGLQHNAEQAPFYNVLSQVVKLGCRAGIFVAERV